MFKTNQPKKTTDCRHSVSLRTHHLCLPVTQESLSFVRMASVTLVIATIILIFCGSSGSRVGVGVGVGAERRAQTAPTAQTAEIQLAFGVMTYQKPGRYQ
jgi:hypothetical protein